MFTVVAQFAEWSLPTTEDIGFESSHRQDRLTICLLKKRKRGREWPVKRGKMINVFKTLVLSLTSSPITSEIFL